MIPALRNAPPVLAAFCLLSTSFSMAAENHAFVGARAASMGGANAVSTMDTTAQWHNPAVFGFMNDTEDAAAETNEVATAGLGIIVLGVRVDVGGAYSLGDKAEYDGNDIPTVARLHAGFSLDY